MAQIDRLLTRLTSKEGRLLRVDPNQQPILEEKDGSSTPLLPNAVPSMLIEHLASEIMSPNSVSELNSRGETHFEYKVGEGIFLIHIARSSFGTQIRAEAKTQDPASAGSSQSPSKEATRIELITQPLPVVLANSTVKNPKASEEESFGGTNASSQSDASRVGEASKVKQSQTSPKSVDQTKTPFSSPNDAPQKESYRVEEENMDQSPSMSFNETPLSASQSVSVSESQQCHPLAEQLFLALVKNNGTDLHLSSFERPLARIDGDLVYLENFTPLAPKQLLEMMASISTLPAWQHFQERNDAEFAYSFEAGKCRLRVSFFMDRVGPALVCRVIPNEIPDAEKLKLSDPIKRLADLSKGLVLVTGPKRSGKSTTLAAIIDLVNSRRSGNILTIEDPIEFIHSRKNCLVNQREVGTHTDNYKTGLKATLREDVDIVMIGEILDHETALIAIELANNGHLVFGTMNTNSAIGTIDYIVDHFPVDRQEQVRLMIADSLKAILNQNLLKKVGGGQVLAVESLFVTPTIANLIREGKNFQIPSAMQTGRAYGQRLINEAFVELVQTNMVLPMEAYAKSNDKETLMSALKRANINWDPRGDEKPMPL